MTDLGFIVKMVVYKCRELGNPVTETLAAYVAQTMFNSGKLSSLSCLSNWPLLLGELDNGTRSARARAESDNAAPGPNLLISQ